MIKILINKINTLNANAYAIAYPFGYCFAYAIHCFICIMFNVLSVLILFKKNNER